MASFSVKLPEELWTRLSAHAARRRVTRSEVAREALDAWLQRDAALSGVSFAQLA